MIRWNYKIKTKLPGIQTYSTNQLNNAVHFNSRQVNYFKIIKKEMNKMNDINSIKLAEPTNSPTELSPDSHPSIHNKSNPRNAGQQSYWNVKSRIRATVFH